jgi:pimeloyl-ACP methyl ester carboxylesterase
MNSHPNLDCDENDCNFWLDLEADITGQALSVQDGEVLEIATISVVNGDTPTRIGTVTAVSRIDETQTPSTWLENIQIPEIPQDAFPAEGPLELRIEPLENPESPLGERWNLGIEAAQVQLVAPPAVVVHGWDPDAEQEEYGRTIPLWEEKLASSVRSEAKDRLGQDPWRWAGKDGFRTFAYDNKKSFQRSAETDLQTEAEESIASTGHGGGVDLLAHSMGGLVSRFLVQQDDGQGLGQEDLVRKLVTLGTPHWGSGWADRYTEVLDMSTKRETSGFFGFGEGHGFYIGNDEDDVGDLSR